MRALIALLSLPGLALTALWLRFQLPRSWMLAEQKRGVVHESVSFGQRVRYARWGRTVNQVASLLPLRSPCLVRSVFLRLMLRCVDVHSVICIGVQLEAGQLRSHAWVEIGGYVLNDRQEIATEFETFGFSEEGLFE